MLKRNKRILTMLSIVAIVFGASINNIKVKATDLKSTKFTVGVNLVKTPSLERNKLDYEGETTVAKVVNARNNIFDKMEEYKKFFKGAQDSKDFTGVSKKLDEFNELINLAMEMGLEFNYINHAINTYNVVTAEIKKTPKLDKVKPNVKPKGLGIHELNEGKVTEELLSYKLMSVAQDIIDGNTYKLDKNIAKIKKMFNEAVVNGEIDKRDIKDIENSIKYIENKNIPALKEMVGIKESKFETTTMPVEVKPTNDAKSGKDNDKEREARVIEEYEKNDILKQALDAYATYEAGLNSKMRSHERRIKEALDLDQKIKVAKKSGTVSKEALEFLDEKIKELNPLYTQLVNEVKTKKIEKDNKVEPKVPVENGKNDAKTNQETKNDKNIKSEVKKPVVDIKPELKEINNKKNDEEKNEKGNNKVVEPKVSVKNEKINQEIKSEKNIKSEIEKSVVEVKSEVKETTDKKKNEVIKQSKLVKTGNNVDTGVLMQLGTVLSLAGAFLIRKFKK